MGTGFRWDELGSCGPLTLGGVHLHTRPRARRAGAPSQPPWEAVTAGPSLSRPPPDPHTRQVTQGLGEELGRGAAVGPRPPRALPGRLSRTGLPRL